MDTECNIVRHALPRIMSIAANYWGCSDGVFSRFAQGSDSIKASENMALSTDGADIVLMLKDEAYWLPQEISVSIFVH